MSKRELPQSSAYAEGPRPKKQKDGNPSNEGVTGEDGNANGEARGSGWGGASRESANAQGLVLWQTVKDAVNKEDRTLSLDFMHRPSKKLYPDYYQQIQRPMFLVDIKKKLDAGGYTSLEAVKQDLELCFTNAKAYNQKNSQIWKDAKHLHKLAHKEYARICPSEDQPVDVDGDGGDHPNGDGADGKKQAKPPNMNRLLKSRLQKLCDKTDDSGRVLSGAFMEFPSKKDWPFYYKQIKRPQCLENIFKHLKRKEYHTSAEFAADVELVFSNALSFNQDGSQIYEDALILRDYFRHLMADLPPPHALPEYSKTAKIKLKVPPTAAAAASMSAQVSAPAAASPQLPSSNAVTSAGGLLLRVPSVSTQQPPVPIAESKVPAALPSAPPPAVVGKTTASPAPTTTRPVPAPVTVPATTVTTSLVNPVVTQYTPSHSTPAYSHHYPNVTYVPPTAVPAVPVASSSTPNALTNPYLTRALQARSVTPPQRLHHPLHSVLITTKPRGRSFRLDHTDGVKNWAMRLGQGESALAVADVRFLAGEEEESSGDEGEDDQKDEEGNENESEAEVDVPVRNGRKRGRGRGRGRTKGGTAKAVAAEKAKAKEPAVKKGKKMPAPEDVQVKLNGVLVDPKEEKGEWHVELLVGAHVLEVGSKGGAFWKVFIERGND